MFAILKMFTLITSIMLATNKIRTHIDKKVNIPVSIIKLKY